MFEMLHKYSRFIENKKQVLRKSAANVKAVNSYKITKSLVYKALNLPFDGKDETYSCMRFAGEAVEGCVAIVREPFADRNYHSSKATCERLVKIAVERGAKLLLCEYELDGYNVVQIEDAFAAWVRITAAYRSLYKPKTVCVTGSIGKTSTTAMTKAVFSNAFQTFCNTGNTNSPNYSSRNAQQLTGDIEAYIQEVMEDPFGVPGDISEMVQPQAAIVTVIGSSHLVSLGSQDTILKSCLSIQNGMPKDGLLILNGDDPLQWNARPEHRVVYYAVNNPKADYRAQNIREENGRIAFDIVYKKKTVHAVLNCIGTHNVGNAVAAFAAGKWAGMSDEQIVEGLAAFRPTGIRQNLIEHGGYRLFLDCYNAAPESMKSALAAFSTIRPREGGRHIAVLADIKESGRKEEAYHREVGRLAAESCVNTLICFGENARLIATGARENGMSDVYETEDEAELDELLRRLITRNDVALFKGSRSMMLEKHVDNVYGTWFYENDDDAISKSKYISDDLFRYRTYPDHAKVVSKLTSQTAVCIPAYCDGKPVTGIESGVFANSKSYTTSVVFPETLKNIREKAFRTVSRLESVQTPNSLLYIAASAFESCRGLRNVEIAEGCIRIGARAFAECPNLSSVSLPASVHEIDEDAFKACPKLVITCPKGSYAEQYARQNGLKTFEAGTQEEPETVRQGKAGRFWKADIDYQYTISRRKGDPKQRTFFEKNGVWQQKNPKADSRAVILCGGDLMCEPLMSESCYFDGEYDYRPCFKFLKPVLTEADFAIANLETIVSDRIPYAREKHRVNHHTGVRYHCNAPAEYLDALRYAGFDGFVLANNHNADGGYDGLIDTLDNLDRRGFMHTGLFRDETDRRVLHLQLNGIRLAVLSYTEHINRRLDEEVLTKEGCDILLNRFSEEKARKDIADARRDGAEFVLVYIHFLGREYSHEVIEGQRITAKKLADAGADCIMGSHMHAIQEFDYVAAADGRRVPVMYSLGNLISSDATGDLIARRSVIYRLVLKKENGCVTIADESYIPVRVVEATRASAFVAFPTLPCLRKNARSNFFEEEQRRIENEIGNKIKPTADCALSTSVPAAKKPTPSVE